MSARKRSKSTPAESEKHFVDMATWLVMESKAEVTRMAERRKQQSSDQAEKSGETILDLVIADHTSGLGGHKLVTFKRRTENTRLPWHRLRVGSPVVVSPAHGSGNSETGVVSRNSPDSIQVALNRWPEDALFRIDLTADEITRQRQMKAIQVVKDARGQLGRFRELTMGNRQPIFADRTLDLDFQTDLNPSQRAAVELALRAEDIAIIHGPPGTGKTTTVVELIVQAVRRGDRVLACAPSNTAVDNLLQRLIDLKQRVVRIGHPARVAERLRNHSLDGLVENHPNMPVIKDMLREAEAIFRKSEKWTRAKQHRGQRQELRQEAKRLQTDARMLEREAVASVLGRAEIICATTTFNEDLLGDRGFDLAVIDEACQSTEPGCWLPVLQANRVVLAGDHQQLPPTVLSEEAGREGFAKSLMERQVEIHGDAITRRLTTQYRMHHQIMEFSSQQFYDGDLIAHESVVNHRLDELAGVMPAPITEEVITFYDSAGASWDEELEPNGLSKRNPHEAELVVKKVDELLQAGVRARDIAVIAPYAAQVRLLRNQFQLSHPSVRGLEVDTVDGFQGREKEAVVITLVRSNQIGEIGFMADRRRMNVALTRAKRKLIVIGDSATLGGSEFYRDFFNYVEQLKCYHSVWEEM